MLAIKGAGDIASGVALRLHRAGYRLVMTDLARPTAIRRTVCFCEALISGHTTVEGVTAVAVDSVAGIEAAFADGCIPVIADADGRRIRELAPKAVIDAILAKRNVGTSIDDAPVVLALGPGFTAGVDCRAVIETMRGHTLGRVILEGSALPNTGVPGNIGGYSSERVLRSPADGAFMPLKAIGDAVLAGDAVAIVAGKPVITALDGVLRGLLAEGVTAHIDMKCGDVDPRGRRDYCFSASDKALAIGGGVLEALLYFGVLPEVKHGNRC